MAISGQHKPTTNHSNDKRDYQFAIYHDALCLIVAGYERLLATGVYYSDKDEEVITGELVRCTQEYIDCPSSWYGAERYHVYEDARENVKGLTGKYRPKVDIVCVLTGIRPQEHMKFEAKRLRRPGFTVSKYVGKDGLGEFISGNYAPECDTAGMLGYIQSDDCDYWAEQIPDALNTRKKEVHLTKDGQWQKASLENVNDCYKTRHNRPTVKRELMVYHLLLDFVN